MKRLLLCPLTAALLLLGPTRAHAEDASGARALLIKGAELRKQGKCAEAIQYLTESDRLDPQSRTLINLADCEEQLARLTSAEAHWARARDLAGQEKLSAIETEASARLSAIEARIPKLVVRVEEILPAGAQVLRDGEELGAVSIGQPLPVNPGEHVVVVRAKGHEDYRLRIDCREHDVVMITVKAGPAIAAAAAPPPIDAPAPAATEAPSPLRRNLAFVAGGVGIVAVGIGTYLAASAKSSWSDAESAHCHGSTCDATGVSQVDSARSKGNVATGVFLGGVAVLGAGVVLFATAPRGSTSAFELRALPIVTARGGAMSLGGTFR